MVATGPVRLTLSWLFKTPLPGVETGLFPVVTDLDGKAAEYKSVTLYAGPMKEEGIAAWEEKCDTSEDFFYGNSIGRDDPCYAFKAKDLI